MHAPPTITAASVMLLVVGVVLVLVSTFLLLMGLPVAGVHAPHMHGVTGLTLGEIVVVSAILVLGVLDIVAAYLLWSMSRTGGYLGLVLAALSIVASAAWGGLGLAVALLSVLAVVFIATGWQYLK